jgi:hypothetical protein
MQATTTNVQDPVLTISQEQHLMGGLVVGSRRATTPAQPGKHANQTERIEEGVVTCCNFLFLSFALACTGCQKKKKHGHRLT